ncbi:MAG: addiction module protein [Planctomycetota bacterium]
MSTADRPTTHGPLATADQIVAAALSLPEAERTRIALAIEESVVPGDALTPAEFGAELDRRIERLSSGDDPGVDARTAISKLERELRSKHGR